MGHLNRFTENVLHKADYYRFAQKACEGSEQAAVLIPTSKFGRITRFSRNSKPLSEPAPRHGARRAPNLDHHRRLPFLHQELPTHRLTQTDADSFLGSLTLSPVVWGSSIFFSVGVVLGFKRTSQSHGDNHRHAQADGPYIGNTNIDHRPQCWFTVSTHFTVFSLKS